MTEEAMMRNLARNTKALSPVIATIILVAVTVAIAIAVAAWLGALTFTYTRTEQLTITSTSFISGNGTAVIFTIANTGTSDVTISNVQAVGSGISGTASSTAYRCGSGAGTLCNGAALVSKGGTLTLTVNFAGVTWNAGSRYDFTLVSSQGNKFPTSVIR